VNRTRNLILHMYDDRGLDLIARHRSDLQAIYDAHKSWVLDYDRHRIERVFEQREERPIHDSLTVLSGVRT